MDALNKAISQLTELLRSMTPGARLTAGLLLAVLVVGLGYLFNSDLSGPDAYLLGGQGFSSEELQAMEAAFGQASLTGYELEGGRVRIPRGQQAAFLAALADGDALPANFGDYMAKAVNDSNPFQTRAQQEETLKVARQQELALIIRSMQGISKANVIIDQQRQGGFRQDSKVTASVFVQPRGGMPLDAERVRAIRYLVAGAVAGLDPRSVTVTDAQGGLTYSSEEGGGPGGENAYLAAMQNFQSEYEEKVRAALAYVAGVTVSANVELTDVLRQTEEQVKVDPKTVPVMSRDETNTSSRQSGGPGGQPGFNAQQPNQGARLANAGGSEDTEESTTSESQSVVGHTDMRTERAGLTPERVSVVVGVPTSYYVRVWQGQNPPATGAEPQTPDATQLAQIETEVNTKIREHVLPLLPMPVDVQSDASQLVRVTSFTDLPTEEIISPPLTATATTWLAQNWQTLGGFALVLFSLLMLRSFVKGAPSPAPLPRNEESAPAAASAEEPPPSAAEKPTRKRRLQQGTNIRDELAEMVKEDPEAAAAILRGWIGNPN